MYIKYGYRLKFEFVFDTPIITMLDIHPSRRHDIIEPDDVTYSPSVEPETYTDDFGNLCTRLVVPKGEFALESDGLVFDTGKPDDFAPEAIEVPIPELPSDALTFLLGSRYCETDKLSDFAWKTFGNVTPGWTRVQSIVDFVHNHITFDYQRASSTRSAVEVFETKFGVCRDFAHLAVTLCRAMSIPARYCTGYLGDIGVPKDPAPMDFSAWFEVYLGGRWYAFDARHNRPRIGRILIGIGRDASDVPIMNTFSSHRLIEFTVITDEVEEKPASATSRSAFWKNWAPKAADHRNGAGEQPAPTTH